MLAHMVKLLGYYFREIQSKMHLPAWKAGLLLCKFLWCRCLFLHPIKESLMYHSLLSNKRAKKTVFYKEDNVRFLELINDQDQIWILRYKHVLLDRLKNHLGRRFIYAKDASNEEILSFIKETPHFVLKPDSDAGGRGIKEVTVKDAFLETVRCMEMERFAIGEAAAAWQGKELLLEDYIVQHSSIREVYEKSVNTVRIHTVNVNGNVDVVLMSSIRFGSGNGNVDSDEGICVGIHEDGTMYPWGIDLEDISGARIYSHPDTGTVLGSRQIPFWGDALDLVKETALAVPQVCFIGWDVAITENGPVIVEGNGAPASYMQEQLYSCDLNGVGIKPEMMELLQQTLLRKQWTQQDIDRITQQVFLPEHPDIWMDCQTVMILGSAACGYRVECAWRIFKDKQVRYIVCGGNRCQYQDEIGQNMLEADYMRERLIQYGVPEKDILIENSSVSTLENIQNAIQAIKDHRFDGPFGIVSAGFHLRRVKKTWDALAFAEQAVVIPAYGPSTRPDNWFESCTGTRIILNELEKLTRDAALAEDAQT